MRVIDVYETKKNIRQLEIKNNLTLQEVADYVGVTNQAVAKWNSQRVKHLPTIENFVILSKLFEVPIDEILKTKEI